MTIPSHLTLTGRPLLLDPKVVPELKARLDAHFAGKDAGPIDRLVGKARKKKMKANALASPQASHQISLQSAVAAQVQQDPYLEVISIRGPLLDRAVFFGKMLCADGYDRISADLSRAVSDPNCAGILLDIDSPGGMVSGCFELSDEIRGARALKPVIAFCSGVTASAAYAIACAATEVIGRESAMIGSVGVIYPRMDWTKANEKDGFNVTIFKSGEKKDWGHPDTVMSEAEAAETQKLIDSLAAKFFARVSAGRGIPVSDIQDLQAGLFITENSVSHGLADAVGEMPDAIARLTELAFAPKEPSPAGDDAPEPADPDPAAGQSTDRKEIKMSKMIRAGLTGQLRFAAAAMAAAHIKAMDEDEKSAIDDEELDAALAEESEDEVAAMDDDEVDAAAAEDYDEDDPKMTDEEDDAAQAKSFRATASRIARKSLAKATTPPAPVATGDAVQDAIAAERARASAIMNLPEAKGREKLAAKLSAKGLSAEDAKEILADQPKASGKPAPIDVQIGNGGGTPQTQAKARMEAITASANALAKRAGQSR